MSEQTQSPDKNLQGQALAKYCVKAGSPNAHILEISMLCFVLPAFPCPLIQTFRGRLWLKS